MGNRSGKIINRIIAAVLCFAVAFCVSGCGGETEYNIDPETMANSILEGISFDADMQQIRNDSIGTFVELPEDRTGYMFMGDGSHSDSFGVFKFNSSDDAKTGEKAIKGYLKEVEDSFSRYIPEEAEKVKNHSVIIRKGANLVFVVSNDEEAESKIEQFFEGNTVQETAAPEDSSEVSEQDNEQTDDEQATDDTEDEQESETSADSEEIDELNTDIDLSKYPTIETKSKLKYVGYIAMIGKSAYEIFDYVDGSAESYAKIVNYAAKKLGDDTKVYDMLIPLSSGVTVPDKYYFEIHGSNQKKSIENVYGKLKDNVVPVRMFDNMMKHRDEYIYFRTDHHWTSLGAYYGYESWCKASGTLPITLDKRKKENYGDFVGAFYNDTNKNSKLMDNPDTLDAYFPVGEVYTKKKDWQGNKYKADIIYDMSDSSVFYKYEAFIGGDQGMMTITNDSINDDSVLVVVKESFGNCLVPYLADHYHKTYVIDYRYTEKNIVDFCKKKGANDLIFVNNIGMTRSGYLIGLLEKAVKG